MFTRMNFYDQLLEKHFFICRHSVWVILIKLWCLPYWGMPPLWEDNSWIRIHKDMIQRVVALRWFRHLIWQGRVCSTEPPEFKCKCRLWGHQPRKNKWRILQNDGQESAQKDLQWMSTAQWDTCFIIHSPDVKMIDSLLVGLNYSVN